MNKLHLDWVAANRAVRDATTDEERVKADAELTRLTDRAIAEHDAAKSKAVKTTLFAADMASYSLCEPRVHEITAGNLQSRVIFTECQARLQWINRDVIQYHALAQAQDALNQRKHINPEVCLVVHGMSGIGKTFGSMLLAASPRTPNEPVEAAVVCLRFKDVFEPRVAIPWNVEFYADIDPGVNRNDTACHAVINAIRRLMQNLQLDAAEVPASTVYVVIDELGDYPHFVRGAIAAVDIINNEVAKLTGAKEARLILVGTGTAGAALHPDSVPDKYCTWCPSPILTWKYLQENEKDADARHVMKNVDERITIEHATANDVVSSNARAAAAFVRSLKDLFRLVLDSFAGGDETVEPKMVGLAAQLAAIFYKRTNALRNLSTEQLITAMSIALAACHINSHLKDDLYARMVCSLGMLTDNARLLQRDKSKSPGTVVLYDIPNTTVCVALLPDARGQRYTLSPSLVTIVELLTNTGSRHRSGEGFERVVADWFMWAIQSSVYIRPLREGTPKSSPAVRLQHDASLSHVSAVPWISPAQFVRNLGELPIANGKCTTVQTYFLKHAYVGLSLHDDDSAAIQNIMRKPNDCVDLILVNADKASFADLIVVLRSRNLIYFVRSKQQQRLTSDEVREELSKMGHQSSELAWYGYISKLQEVHKKPKASNLHKGFVANVLNYLELTLKKNRPSEKEVREALECQNHFEALRDCLRKGGYPAPPVDDRVDISAIRQLLLSKSGTVRYVIFQYGKTAPGDIELKKMPAVDIIFASSALATGNQFSQQPLFPVTVPPSGERSGLCKREDGDELLEICISPPE
jgi:hypothetical protein